VLFVGLAPGLIGIWQMDAVVPADWPHADILFQIEFYSPPPNSLGESTGIGLVRLGTQASGSAVPQRSVPAAALSVRPQR
jgi:hypothetical protein